MVHVQKVALPRKVVVIGGGTGNSTVLAGLSPYIRDGLTAVVNTFDDGGGAGRLRDEYADLSAVGDLRQCAVAMSSAPKKVQELFNYRFPEGSGGGTIKLHGQTLGNLIITAAGQKAKGNLSEALQTVSDIFNILGCVVPASNDNRRLLIELIDGRIIEGEQTAEETKIPSFMGARVGFNKTPTRITKEASKAIREADMVVLAPGDLYTSLAPTLVVSGMKEALQATKTVVLVSNLMNREQHTQGFTTADYVQEYSRLIGDRVIDRVIYNTGSLNQKALHEQVAQGSHPVLPDVERLEDEGYIARGYDLSSKQKVLLDPNDAIAASRSTIRHDPAKIALALIAEYVDSGSHKANKSSR